DWSSDVCSSDLGSGAGGARGPAPGRGRGGRVMKIVILGLSITSSWGNGHATTYRGLVRELAARGHEVVFLERDLPWYAEHRDLRRMRQVEVSLYRSVSELQRRHAATIRGADAVIVGSYVPEGVAV